MMCSTPLAPKKAIVVFDHRLTISLPLSNPLIQKMIPTRYRISIRMNLRKPNMILMISAIFCFMDSPQTPISRNCANLHLKLRGLMDTTSIQSLIPAAGVIATVGGAWLTVRKIAKDFDKSKKEQAAEILHAAKEEDALMKAKMEAKIAAL